jgi:hypothetical protein
MKNYIIASVVGLVFMGGGFFVGMRLMPTPPPAPKVAATPATTGANLTQGPISMEALRKASESMMTLNQSLQEREQKVAAREERAKQREVELQTERAALNRSHDKFKELFMDFKQRLQLVDTNETDQLQKEATIFMSMDSAQAIDLIRAMDDPAMIRLFSVMDVKPLAKLIADWKVKYPNDTPRLLAAMDGMSQVMPKDKIALTDPTTGTDAGASSQASPTPDTSMAPDSTTPDATAAPAADPNAPATTTPPADPNSSAAPAPTDSNSSTTPPPDATPSTTPPADPSTPAPAPASDPAAPTPASSSTPAASNPDPAPATPLDSNSAPETAATN